MWTVKTVLLGIGSKMCGCLRVNIEVAGIAFDAEEAWLLGSTRGRISACPCQHSS